MRILYVTADPGIEVNRPSGAGAHIGDTIDHLRRMGHTVRLVAPGDPSKTMDPWMTRVVKHTWFGHLDGLKNWGRISRTNQLLPPMRQTALEKENRKAGQEVSGSMPHPSHPTPRERLSALFHGEIRHTLNRLEELTLYKHRFLKQVQACIRTGRFHGVYERYALGHHGTATLCSQYQLPHILEVNALLAKEAFYQKRMPVFMADRAMANERRFLGSVRHLFVVSKGLKNQLDALNDAVTVNPNGVDAHLFDPERPLADIRGAYNINGRPVVGWVGSFSQGRGVEAVLAIAAKLAPKVPDLCVMLVGDGPLRPWVEKQISKMRCKPAVVLTGTVPRQEMPAYVKAMDIALAPYPAFGATYFSPLKVFEYMAMARPVAATGVGQCISLLKDGAGLLLPPDQPDVWADALADLFNAPQKRAALGARARQRVLSSFTWSQNADRIVRQFQKMGPKTNSRWAR